MIAIFIALTIIAAFISGLSELNGYYTDARDFFRGFFGGLIGYGLFFGFIFVVLHFVIKFW